MTDKLIDNKRVAELLGYAMSTWYTAKHTEEFKTLPRCPRRKNRYYEDEVVAWIKGDQPSQMRQSGNT